MPSWAIPPFPLYASLAGIAGSKQAFIHRRFLCLIQTGVDGRHGHRGQVSCVSWNESFTVWPNEGHVETGAKTTYLTAYLAACIVGS